ncbi:MAG: nicotinamide-nucleotide amidohydrolase family protein, partial [Thermoleophilia bacterium]|nr:nicotinamide-nucleotide amidohydrolase family protein [Thermoleophilia bacterium]
LLDRDQVVARATGRPLALDERALERVEARSGSLRGDPAILAALRRKQAMLPDGSVMLPPPGTAPGCIVRHGGTTLVVLPGPPWELETMWEAALGEPVLAEVIARAPAADERVLRIHGVPESTLVSVIADLDRADWGRLRVGICARDGELEMTVRCAPADSGAADALEALVVEGLGDAVFSRDGATIDDVVARLLTAAGQTVAVAESCTGGGLGERLTARAGSSAYVLGGIISYADAVKVGVLGVDPAVIARHGAVSPECAAQMAVGARHLLGSDWAVAITGIAGPGGGSDEKPVGLVHLALAGPAGVVHLEQRRGGDRDSIRARAVAGALHLLRLGISGTAGG